ncbi:MAG: hypothetical protein AMXMBFR84_46560 [Candidatus Hydrogenedentota bacterium]
MISISRILMCIAAIGLTAFSVSAQEGVARSPIKTVLVIVLDGLRPDYVTPELMPALHAFAEQGITAERHHSVFPTVTRVNASSISTGAYPSVHGMMGNTVYFPGITDAPKSSGNAQNLIEINENTGNRLQTATTLAEVIQGAGGKLFVASAGSSGSAYCLNSRVSGGAIVNTELVLPVELQAKVDEMLGPVPEESFPNTPLNKRAVDAYLKIGLDFLKPSVTLMWLSDPDHTGHAKGIGSEEHLACLRAVDAEFARILAEHEMRGIARHTDIIVTSDHGFSTHAGKNMGDFMNVESLKPILDAHPMARADGAIYLQNATDDAITAVVKHLQTLPWVGALFTRAAEPGSPMGVVPGTLSLDLVYYNHERSPQILMDSQWSDDANAMGWKGTTQQTGVAGHGTSSPWDIHNTLIAGGPSFKARARSAVPTGNVDIAPTVCRILGISPAGTMQGRVLEELLKDGPDPASIEINTNRITTSVDLSHETYQLELVQSQAKGGVYVDYTKVVRTRHK